MIEKIKIENKEMIFLTRIEIRLPESRLERIETFLNETKGVIDTIKISYPCENNVGFSRKFINENIGKKFDIVLMECE